jgi:hypothetical protein
MTMRSSRFFAPVFRRCDVDSAKRRRAGEGQKGLDTVQDAKTRKLIYRDPAGWCKKVKVEDSPAGLWNEYCWPKPGEMEPSRKLSYHLPAQGTPYLVPAGIYDRKATVAGVSKLGSMKPASSLNPKPCRPTVGGLVLVGTRLIQTPELSPVALRGRRVPRRFYRNFNTGAFLQPDLIPVFVGQ